MEALYRTVTTDDAVAVLDGAGLRAAVMASLTRALDEQLKRRAGAEMDIEAIFFSNRYGILGRTAGADRLAALHPISS